MALRSCARVCESVCARLSLSCVLASERTLQLLLLWTNGLRGRRCKQDVNLTCHFYELVVVVVVVVVSGTLLANSQLVLQSTVFLSLSS